MTASAAETTATADRVELNEESLVLLLADGRTVSAPLVWYPRLLAASVAERSSWRLIGQGRGVHWPELDEDISVANVLAGRGSQESPKSLARWLASRASGA